jgi:SecD/SecF fusion protein
MSGWLKFLLIAAVFGIPIVIGNTLSKSLRLPDQSFRFFIVSFAVIASLAIILFGGEPKLGIDLRGGVILVYELKRDPQGNLPSGETVDKLVGIVKKRLDPGNVQEIVIRPYGLDKIEVIVPTPVQDKVADAGDNQEILNRIKEKISTSGALAFRITANTSSHQTLIDRARNQQRDEERTNARIEDLVLGQAVDPKDPATRPELARWIPVKPDAIGEFTGPDYITRTVDRGSLGNEFQVLVVKDPYDVTGQYLASARSGVDEKAKPAVFFNFTYEGADRFSKLTSSNLPKNDQYSHLGIVLDDIMQSAPRIITTISDSGQITGNYTEDSAKNLAEILNAGGLPAAIEKKPVSEQLVSATLGQDTIDSGIRSMLVATGVVVIFMLIYYRFAGLVANLALLLNVSLIVAFMIMFNAAFTLSGLAGLALTVGMAVDANVLIYERMREELNRGATLRMAIRNGFDRATVTIIDANVTTLITAIVLYVIGTDQVKGFAVTLTVGILMNLFTAITCTRLMFDIAERNRWVTNMKFMQIMSSTNFDFIGKRHACYALSVVLLSAGLIGAVIRGKDLFNIDFTGGTSVTTVFEKAPAGGIGEVRREIEKKLREATVQEVNAQDQPKGTWFKIVTEEPDQAKVEAAVKEAFGSQLKVYRVKRGELVKLAAAVVAPQTNDVEALAVADAQDVEAQAADVTAGEFEEFDSSCQPIPTASPSATGTTAPPSVAPASLNPSSMITGPVNIPGLPQFNTPAPAATATPATGSVSVNPYAGGTSVELKFEPKINYRRLTEMLKVATKDSPARYELITKELDVKELARSSRSIETWQLRTAASGEQVTEILNKLDAQLAAAPFFPSSESVGAAVAGGARSSAIWAMVVSLFLVMVYVWFRFQDMSFGFAAILALVHDVLFTIGCLALSKWLAPFMGFALVDPFKIDLTIVAALLTIIGFSLNDTIVIFDRIREVRGKSPAMTGQIINLCVNQTLSRTILTSLTVFLVVVILYFWGGPGIHGFAFAMVVGTISGTYSTIYVASPFLLWLFRKQNASVAAKGGAASAAG